MHFNILHDLLSPLDVEQSKSKKTRHRLAATSGCNTAWQNSKQELGTPRVGNVAITLFVVEVATH